MRAFSVRVTRSTSGRIADSLPGIMLTGPAACTSAAAPTRSCEAIASGTSAITQTELRSAMRNSVTPGETMAPSRTPSSATTPEVGANSVKRVCAEPDCSERATTSSGIDSSRRRARDASTRACPGWACRMPRYSSSAAAHSGAYSVASACPLRTGASTARTCSFSTYPVTRVCTTSVARSFCVTTPTASMLEDRSALRTTVVRIPRLCATAGLMAAPAPAP